LFHVVDEPADTPAAGDDVEVGEVRDAETFELGGEIGKVEGDVVKERRNARGLRRRLSRVEEIGYARDGVVRSGEARLRADAGWFEPRPFGGPQGRA